MESGVRWTRQWRVTGGMICMKRLSILAVHLMQFRDDNSYLVTLSREWKTIEFLHMAIAKALFPYAKQ